MGTIAEKLSYLDETREQILSNINALGGDLTEEDTFRSYAKELDNIWEEQPHTTETGTSLSLDTKKGKAKVDLDGNTSQYTTTGKNLFNPTYQVEHQYLAGGEETSGANNGYSLSNGVITSSKNVQAVGRRMFNKMPLSAGTYTISGKVKFTGASRYFMFNSVRNMGTQTDIMALTELNVGSATGTFNFSFTLSQDTEDVSISLQPMTANDGTLELSELQLEKGSTATSYEPYTGGIASPNPSYPQQVHVVSGDNSINVVGKNLFDKTRYLNAVVNNTSVGATGTLDSFSNSYATWIQMDNNASYTFSGDLSSVNSNVARAYVTNDEVQLGTSVKRVNNIANGQTYTNSDNYKYLVLVFLDVSSYNDSFKWQIEVGSTPTTYEPYQSTSYPIHLGEHWLGWIGDYKDRFIRNEGKNLLPYYQSGTYTHNGITYTSSGNGVYTISNTATDNSYWEMTLDESYTIEEGDYIQLNNDKVVSNAQFVLRDTSNVQIAAFGCSEINRIISLSSYVGKAIGRIRCYVVNGTAVGNMALKPMICKSSTSVPFEPYGTNEWYLEKKIGKQVFNGSENWVASSTYQGSFYLHQAFTEINWGRSFSELYSNIFSRANVDNYQSIAQNYTKGTMFIEGVNIIDCWYGDSSGELSAFKTFLSNNNLILYYPLATPTYTPITGTLKDELEAVWRANTYANKTNVSQINADLPFKITMKALSNE